MVATAALTVAIAAASEPPAAVTIEWNAPPTCPSPATVDEGLRRWIRSEPSEPIRVRADVKALEDGYAADLLVETAWGSSHRHIEASACEGIADTTVLIAAIAADPLAVASQESLPSMSPPPVAAPPPRIEDDEPLVDAPAVADDRPPRAEAPRTRTRRRPRGIVRIEGAFGLGIVPRPSGGFGGALGVQWKHLELGVGAMWWPPRTTESLDSGAAASIGLVAIAPYACGFLGRRAWSIGVCGSVEPGVMTGSGVDVGSATSQSVAWVGLGLGPRVRWSPIERIGIVAGIDGVAVVHRARFVVANEGDVYRSEIAGFRVRLGLEVRWP